MAKCKYHKTESATNRCGECGALICNKCTMAHRKNIHNIPLCPLCKFSIEGSTKIFLKVTIKNILIFGTIFVVFLRLLLYEEPRYEMDRYMGIFLVIFMPITLILQVFQEYTRYKNAQVNLKNFMAEIKQSNKNNLLTYITQNSSSQTITPITKEQIQQSKTYREQILSEKNYILCRVCGFHNKADMDFCEKCGYELE